MLPGATTRADANRKPCSKCGADKGPGRGKKWCDDCFELVKWQARQRRKARIRAKRLPCKQCGGPKGPGVAKVFCDACLEKRSFNRCWRCKEYKIKRPSKRNYCDECKEEARQEKRIKDAERKRNYRKDPEKLERMRASQRAYCKRRRQDVKKRKEWLEKRRIEYRLRSQNNGVKPRVVSLDTYRNGNGKIKRSERLPVEPLIAFLECTELSYHQIADLCEIDEAVIRRIMSRESETKEISMVDHICCSMGMPTAVVYGDDFAVDCTQAS